MLKVSVQTLVEAEEAVADLVERVFHQTPVLYTDEETLVTEVSVYCLRPAQWSPQRRAGLEAGLQRIRATGLPMGRGRIRVQTLRSQDWAESWKRHFKPLAIGAGLLVQPTWSRRRPQPGQAVVVLDPGLSFGTGQHPTTAYCLEEVLAGARLGSPPSFLDAGTGSGILAIAAAKLGYQPVHAFDNDPVAVKTARANAELNQVRAGLRLGCGDVRRFRPPAGRRFTVVCANLLADLLVEQAGRLATWLVPGGRLIVAGIQERQFPAVRSACEWGGLRLGRERVVKGWHSARFTRT